MRDIKKKLHECIACACANYYYVRGCGLRILDEGSRKSSSTSRVMPRALVLLILAQVWLSRSHFVFELEVDLGSVTAGDFSCDIGSFDDAQCLLYFEIFCLREGRENSPSTNENDCPLGKNTERMNAHLENESNTRRITSNSPWPVRIH